MSFEFTPSLVPKLMHKLCNVGQYAILWETTTTIGGGMPVDITIKIDGNVWTAWLANFVALMILVVMRV